jgi:ornithine decarboxylase
VFSLDNNGHAVQQPSGHTPFRVYGPTCDTLDVLPKPLMLPDNIKPGGYIVVDAIGAYSVALRTNFNGFYPDHWAIIGN